MAYIFSQLPTASARIVDFNGIAGNTLNLTNINSTLSADSLISGMQQFLDVSGLSQAFDPENVSCSIVQSVIEGIEPTPSGKIEPNLSVGAFEVDGATRSAAITYDGDGELYVSIAIESGWARIITKNNNKFVNVYSPSYENPINGVIFASEGNNYSQKSFSF